MNVSRCKKREPIGVMAFPFCRIYSEIKLTEVTLANSDFRPSILCKMMCACRLEIPNWRRSTDRRIVVRSIEDGRGRTNVLSELPMDDVRMDVNVDEHPTIV